MASSPSRGEYSPVDSDAGKGETDTFLSSDRESCEGVSFPVRRRSRLRRLIPVVPWLLSFAFAAISLFLFLKLLRVSSSLGSYETGYRTDMRFPSDIPLETVRFRSSPHFDSNGTISLSPADPEAPWPENADYFGTPTEEIDAAWEKLIGRRYVAISEEEAIRAWGDKRHIYVDETRGGYTAGLDVFHTLHCINALRMSFYPDYYHSGKVHGRGHLEHCLDILRQSVQCYGSTTLIPGIWRESLSHNYIDSDQIHTCRSFTDLRDWTDRRAQGQDLAVERDLSVVDPRKHRVGYEFVKEHGEDTTIA